MLISQDQRNIIANIFPPAHYFRGLGNQKLLNKSILINDDIIADAIQSGKPALIGRLGGTEARVLSCYLDIYRCKSIYDPLSTLFSIFSFKKRLKQLNSGAGVYPINKLIVKTFISEQLQALLEVDVLGTWGSAFTWVEKYALEKPNRLSVSHHSVAPWVEKFPAKSESGAPWSSALANKKVLVIGGFAESFKSQHARIEKVFPKNIYPTFTAEFIKSPISTGGLEDGLNWIDHLERIKGEMQKIEFDVALIAAGAYALPLAYHAKKLGKVGITCGGELQLFFGVIGKRWEDMDKVIKYRNEFWIRPRESERPANWREIEEGCYW